MKVSVITATWNSGKTLCTTLDSVLSQSYPDIEHIIVDGGSTDNTMEIVREYEPRYNGRLRFISEPDKGLYDAMNKGIRMSTGEVVGILNSDDFYTSSDVVEKLEKISGITSKNGRNDAKRLNIRVVTMSNDDKPKNRKTQRKADLRRRMVCKSLPVKE
mgnify:CR=1 FL=1